MDAIDLEGMMDKETISKVKYDGWVMTNNWEGIMPTSFHRTRTEVIKWWDDSWDETAITFKWRNFRKRGTHKIVKARIVGVDE